MKKLGIILFFVTLITGLVVSNLYSFGRSSNGIFNLKVDFGSVKGSGNVVQESRPVSEFTRISVGGVFRVEVTAQQQPSIQIEADDNLLPLIKTEVRGGVLQIESDRRFSSSKPVIVRVSAPSIEGLEVSGAASVQANAIKAGTLSLDCSGASKLSVSGDVDELNVSASGASNVDARSLAAANADVDASGASKVAVKPLNTLTADASGGSRITYTGEPSNVRKNTSGAGSIAKD